MICCRIWVPVGAAGVVSLSIAGAGALLKGSLVDYRCAFAAHPVELLHVSLMLGSPFRSLSLQLGSKLFGSTSVVTGGDMPVDPYAPVAVE